VIKVIEDTTFGLPTQTTQWFLYQMLGVVLACDIWIHFQVVT